MLRRFFFGDDDETDPGAMARRVHSAWLTRMLRRGGKGSEASRIPRIPTRKVSEGGFAPLMATVEGREWAEGWWAGVLGREDFE